MNDRYFVVDQTDAIHHDGTEAECRAFLVDPITKEIAAAGGLALRICIASEWERRNSPEELHSVHRTAPTASNR